MIEDTIEVSLTPADAGETGYRMVSAAVSAAEGSKAGARVHFEIKLGPGGLGSEKVPALELETDEWGIAEVNWHSEPFPRSDPGSRDLQEVTIRASTEDDSARTLKLHITQTNWLPKR
jgi:hypothetical protein